MFVQSRKMATDNLVLVCCNGISWRIWYRHEHLWCMGTTRLVYKFLCGGGSTYFIPYTLTFCGHLTATLPDKNLLNASKWDDLPTPYFYGGLMPCVSQSSSLSICSDPSLTLASRQRPTSVANAIPSDFLVATAIQAIVSVPWLLVWTGQLLSVTSIGKTQSMNIYLKSTRPINRTLSPFIPLATSLKPAHALGD